MVSDYLFIFICPVNFFFFYKIYCLKVIAPLLPLNCRKFNGWLLSPCIQCICIYRIAWKWFDVLNAYCMKAFISRDRKSAMYIQFGLVDLNFKIAEFILRISILYFFPFPHKILYIYGPCCRDIWRFVYPKKSYFSRAKPDRIWLLRVSKASYITTTRAINCLLYRNYNHNNKTFF